MSLKTVSVVITVFHDVLTEYELLDNKETDETRICAHRLQKASVCLQMRAFLASSHSQRYASTTSKVVTVVLFFETPTIEGFQNVPSVEPLS